MRKGTYMSIFSELQSLDTSQPKYEKHIRKLQRNAYNDIEERSNTNSHDTYNTNKDVLLDSKEDSSNDTQDNSIQQETDSSITSNTESIQENKHIQAIQVQHTDITNNEHDIVNTTTNHTENLDINTPIISQNDSGIVSNESILSLDNETLKDSNELERQNQRGSKNIDTLSNSFQTRLLQRDDNLNTTLNNSNNNADNSILNTATISSIGTLDTHNQTTHIHSHESKENNSPSNNSILLLPYLPQVTQENVTTNVATTQQDSKETQENISQEIKESHTTQNINIIDSHIIESYKQTLPIQKAQETTKEALQTQETDSKKCKKGKKKVKNTATTQKISLQQKLARVYSKLSTNFTNICNNFTHILESLLLKEPLVYSLAYENNIATKFNEHTLVTKDGNLCAGIKLEGISYANATINNELELASLRNQFFNRLDSSIELNIFCKKELGTLCLDSKPCPNPYANEIIKKWEHGIKIFTISYYLIFSTKTKRLTGYFESKKRKMTEEQSQDSNTLSYENKYAKLQNILQLAKADLSEYNPKVLNSDDILNFYATYSNMQHTNLTYSHSLLSDCYITSDVEFKKDYMVFSRNDNKEVYARFISIKAYETENLSSIIPTSILRENTDYYYIIHAEAIPKSEAIKKVKRVRTFAIAMIQNTLDELVQLLQSDRENIIKISLSVLVISHIDKEDLDSKSETIKKLLERQNLSVTKETLNQKPLFFSFFPSRGNLNARMRHQTSAALSTLVTFENDILGNKQNRWGAKPVSLFQHIGGSPFYFNFHDNATSSAVGHTLVIGGTGYGKTTIMQFLMLNLFKYDINIFAMDKMRGMHNFTHYIGGEYHDVELDSNVESSNMDSHSHIKGFQLNPFSLHDTSENNLFLHSWLCEMGNIGENEHDLRNIVKDTLTSLRDTQKHYEDNSATNWIPSFYDFYETMRLPDDKLKDIKERFNEYKEGLFDNKKDALNFDKQLSILNMDSILKNPKLSSLSAMYLFHKIKNISKNANKGFFIWIDELRDYLNDESMRDKIIEMIVEIRKINGVITMGIQNLDFLEHVKNANTFIDNMSNYIIFPTKDEKTLAQLESQLSLSANEINFLRNTSKQDRQILFKQKEMGSAILNVNLERLGNYLKIFSSSASDVLKLRELQDTYKHEWREYYLKA